MGIAVRNEFYELETSELHELDGKSDLASCYSLLDVLSWLPEETEESNGKWELDQMIIGGKLLLNYTHWPSGITRYSEYLPIEQLITKGLTEGWPAKGNLSL